MIPEFPEFKKLALSDKAEIDAMLGNGPAHSDFEFGSLYVWNTSDEVELSILYGNLAVRFSDYVTEEPFFMFLGEYEPDATADALLTLSEESGYGSALRLIPEETATKLDASRFSVVESRDHFDYLYEIGQYLTYSGGKLKAHRNYLNSFQKQYPSAEVSLLDVRDADTRAAVIELCKKWEENRGGKIDHEPEALQRFMDASDAFPHVVIGVSIDGKLAAFCIAVLLPGAHANALFGKADTGYHGIYSFLMHSVAKELLSRGYTHLNYQQDLGYENLRRSKMTFHPTGFIKKYTVSYL